MREVLNAIFYLWPMGLNGEPYTPRLTQVAKRLHLFSGLGSRQHLGKLNHVLRTKVKLQAGRNAKPSAGSVDSQSVFWAWLWQCLQVIWIDSTLAGKELTAKIQQQVGWNLEHLKRTDEEPGFTNFCPPPAQ